MLSVVELLRHEDTKQIRLLLQKLSEAFLGGALGASVCIFV